MSASKSAPASPKGKHCIQKSSTMPSGNAQNMSFSSEKKLCGSTWITFFKRFSPRCKRSSSKHKEQTFGVVEFSQSNDESHPSDLHKRERKKSFEMVMRYKEQCIASSEQWTTDAVVSSTCSQEQKTKYRWSDISRRNITTKMFKCGSCQEPKRSRSDVSDQSFSVKLSSKKSLQDIKVVLKQGVCKGREESNSGEDYSSKRHEKVIQLEKEKLDVIEVHVSRCSKEDMIQKASVERASRETSSVVLCGVSSDIENSAQNYAQETTNVKPQTVNKASPSLSVDTGVYLLPELGSRFRKAQPPQSLNLRNKICVRTPQVEKVANKMASLESIGACSLDMDATGSESSGATDVKGNMAQSDHTLNSMNVAVSVLSSAIHKEGGLSEPVCPVGDQLKSDAPFLVNSKWENTSPKLPSYVGISCAINGYTNYSRFCHSRDNSPARVLDSALSPWKCLGGNSFSNIETKESVPLPVSSTCNMQSGNRNGLLVYETCISSSETFVVQNGEKTHESYKSAEDVVRTGEKPHQVSSYSGVSVNGHSSDVASRSFVRQRIEKLNGNAALEGWMSNRGRSRLQKSSETPTELDVQKSPRSPSCPPQTTRGRSKSPPVFHNLTKYFKEQLQIEIVESSWSPSPNIAPTTSPQAQEGYVKKQVMSHEAQNQENGAIAEFDKEKDSSSVSKSSEPTGSSVYLQNKCQMSSVTSHPMSTQNLYEHLEANSPVSPNIPMLQLATPAKLEQPESHDGEWFLAIMEQTKQHILYRMTEAEHYLEEDGIPEDGAGRIRAAVGKANLLLSQKFEQFRQLCEKNLNQDITEPFPTTLSDLNGFWDMVMLQVNDVFDTFANLEKLRANKWVELELPKPATQSRIKRATKHGVSKSTPASPQRSSKAIEAARAREEARRRLMEAKRKGHHHASSENPSEISIFVSKDKN
ncbi:uncharacterized protein LOC143232667 [Tachypleus tridentatus]|uniref:uncharacterized protein LOC143232667 n=1 Tax=Tachypleus tridentatus TaxID=6853 RepID=UPI003FD0434C